jgi:hypothetical protein
VGVKPQALDHEHWHDYEVQAPLQTPGNDIGDHLAAGSSAAKEGVQVALQFAFQYCWFFKITKE